MKAYIKFKVKICEVSDDDIICASLLEDPYKSSFGFFTEEDDIHNDGEEGL